MDILNGRELILASASPRRDELLTVAGLPHRVFPWVADRFVPYTPGEPEEFVRESARQKGLCAADCWSVHGMPLEGVVLLSADTVVYSPSTREILGKPRGREDAYRMLRTLSGSKHQVLTGYFLARAENGALIPEAPGKTVSACVVTDVWFRPLSDGEIYDYIDLEKPFDKAGAYGIQERAALFVTRIDGDYCNIVGLPIARIYTDLAALCR